MSDQYKSREQLEQELAEARNRLAQCTEEKEALRSAEQAARERAAFLQELIDSADDVIQLVGLDGMLKFVSRSIEKHSGYTLEEIAGIPIARIYPPEELGRMADMIMKLLDSPIGTATKFTHRAINKDGSEVLLETTSVNRSDPPLRGQVAVTRVISDRASTDEMWLRAHEMVSTVFNGIHDAVFVHDREGRMLRMNAKAVELFEMSYDRFGLGSAADTYYWLEPDPLNMRRIWKEVLEGQPMLAEGRARRFSDGFVFDVEVYLGKIRLQDQDCILATIRDITERKRMEKQLKDSLAEKEGLLRELHHRVKNNFAVMASLLRLQARRTKEQAVVDILKETEFRVRCMGLVHDKLHQSESLEAIKVNDYLQSLVDNLEDVYGTRERGISIRTELEKVSLGADTAIPLGFITSELVSNAIKHAFPDCGGGLITIVLRRPTGPTGFELVVTDNGKGIPKDLRIEKLPSLGLTLVTTFVQQLGGKLAITSDAGTSFRITFDEQRKLKKTA